jgi:3-phenylpropionate/cinnamic acid dioxygenase small subunit
MPPNSPALDVLAAARAVPRDLQQAIEQFLFYEAALLNDGQFDEWFALLAPDIRYYMPLRATRAGRDQASQYSGPRDIAYFDETKASLDLRIRRLHTSSAWAEEPPSRTRRFLTNVRINPLPTTGQAADGAAVAGEFEVLCAFLLYRNRGERQTDIFAGERIDGLRRADTPAGFEIFARTILIDQTTLVANNISFFF